MWRLISCLGLLTITSLSPAIAQSLAVGVKAGFPITDEISGTDVDLRDESKRYTVGPMLDLHLPWRLAVEFDSLYRREGYTRQELNSFEFFIVRERANSWEFPVIVKYRLPAPAWEPYVGLGYAPRVVTGSDVLGQINYDPFKSGVITSVFSNTLDTHYETTHGLVVVAGFDFKLSRARISPEVRYTHWNKPYLTQGGSLGAFYSSQQNQVEMLFGLTWH